MIRWNGYTIWVDTDLEYLKISSAESYQEIHQSGQPLNQARFEPGTALINTKVKQSHYTPWRRLEEKRHSSYSFFTSARDWNEWSVSRSGRALPGKGLLSTHWMGGWAPEPVSTQRLEKNSSTSAGDRTLIARSSSPQSGTILTELMRLPHKYKPRASYIAVPPFCVTLKLTGN
jgi:hypothetical protein